MENQNLLNSEDNSNNNNEKTFDTVVNKTSKNQVQSNIGDKIGRLHAINVPDNLPSGGVSRPKPKNSYPVSKQAAALEHVFSPDQNKRLFSIDDEEIDVVKQTMDNNIEHFDILNMNSSPREGDAFDGEFHSENLDEWRGTPMYEQSFNDGLFQCHNEPKNAFLTCLFPCFSYYLLRTQTSPYTDRTNLVLTAIFSLCYVMMVYRLYAGNTADSSEKGDAKNTNAVPTDEPGKLFIFSMWTCCYALVVFLLKYNIHKDFGIPLQYLKDYVFSWFTGGIL